MNLLIEHLGWTLLHSLWQGALLATAVQLAWPFLERHSARARYNLACLALALFALAPVLTFCGLAATERPVLPVQSGVSPSAPTSTVSVTLGLAPGPSPVPFSVSVALRPVLPWLVGLWLLGAGCSVLRLALAWRRVRRLAGSISEPLPDAVNARLVQLAARLGIRRAVRAGLSAAVTVPTVIGWARPVILVPVALLAGLSPVQLDALLAHELAHIRRHDFLVNVLQTVCEALFFYHPAIYALNRRIRAERENACDDIAVGVTGNAVDYARALATLEATRTDALALAATGDGELLARVRRLLGFAPAGGSRVLRIAKVVLATVGLGAVTIVVLAVGLRSKVYQSETTVQVLRRTDWDPADKAKYSDDQLNSFELNTVVKLLESSTILKKVSDRLTGDDLHRFMAPYEKGPGGTQCCPTISH